MTTIDHWVAEIKQAAEELDGEKVKNISAQLVKAIEHHQNTDHDKFREKLRLALIRYDDIETQSLCEQLIANLQSTHNQGWLTGAHEYLKLLQRKRKFALILQIADVVLQSGEYQPNVKRLYAQALIEEQRLVAAIDVLTELESRCRNEKHVHEATESRGLLGRAWKQIYINAADTGNVDKHRQAALENAVRIYREEFDHDPENRLWQGINAVALTHRARRDGIALSDDIADSANTVLASTLNSIRKRMAKVKPQPDQIGGGGLTMWDQAIAAEAFLANDEYAEAVRWIARYAGSEHADDSEPDAFEIASTLRQFEQVWQLDDDNPDEKKILELLRAALLSREGGMVSTTNPAADSAAISEILADSSFEKVLGQDRYNNLRWYQAGLERAQCVCRVEDAFGTGFGTGFLVRSKLLGLSDAQEWVVLTNSHVVSEAIAEQHGHPAALAPEASRIRFEAVTTSDTVLSVTGVLAWSPRDELDFSVLAIEGLDHIPATYRIAKHLPMMNTNQRIYIIGHPKGGKLSFSLNDNLLLDHEAPKLHYRSPTEGGSSGSPVFNQAWELIGLHHAGSDEMRRLNGQTGYYPANEGISIQSIILQISNASST